MFHHNGADGQCHNGNNNVKKQHNSHTNQATNKHLHHHQQSIKSTSTSFIKLFNPFSSKSKSHTISADNSDKCDVKCVGDKSNEHKASVKVLKQFWNEQIKTAKSTEHLHNASVSDRNQKSATLKYFSQSTDSINEPKLSRAEKALTLDGSLRLPLDDFNKYKDANFIKNKKIKLLDTNVTRTSRPESFTLNDNIYPQISSSGGKIHWAKREDIFTSNMSVKNKTSSLRSPDGLENKSKRATRSDSVTSSVGSVASNTSSLNNANRKFSFKTNPATTASYMNKKLSSNGGNKVAQIAQRFNQIIQQDATILEEVKKRGTVVVHHTGGRVFKIKEEKVDKKKSQSDDAISTLSDDAISLPSIGGKNSTRRKSTLKKRPSIRILVESTSRKDSAVLSKRQLYEANIVNKETIVLKPKVPDKSERVLAKTKELKSKKLNEILKTERLKNDKNLNKASSNNKFALNKELNNVVNESIASNVVDSSMCVNNELLLTNGDAEETSEQIKDTSSYSSPSRMRKIYDKITFRPTFLYGKKVNSKVESKSTTLEDHREEEENVVAAAEGNKAEIEDELEFKSIDLNLNVYFNSENLSTNNETDAIVANIAEDENASSQGSQNDVTKNHKPDQPLMKPNESFLFSRSLSATKFENTNASDTFSFIRGMLEDQSTENLSSTIDDEDNYEIISRGDESRCSEQIDSRRECVDIDKNKRDDNDDGVRQECNEEENIYQSLCEVKGSVDDAISIKSYESFENYDEIKQGILDNKINLSDLLKSGEDDYIFPEASPPQLPAPRKNTIPKISSPILTSTTSNLVQANNLPKLQKSNSCISTTYEKIKYDQLPSKHSTVAAEHLPLPPRNNIHNANKQSKHDENIYDTIKSGGSIFTDENYEKIPVTSDNIVSKNNNKNKEEIIADTFDINDNDNPYKNSKNDTMSIISNCYESISLKQSYSTINQILRHAISSTTLTSEHRINSIYGESLAGQSLTPPSDRSGVSDNSDEWIDVESEEEAENNDRFIVICKKPKTHRSPDWSRLVRQKLDEWEDDSDHHYESLYSIQQQRAALEGKLESVDDKPLSLGGNKVNIGTSNGLNSNYLIDKFGNDDDYSSFESDDDNSRYGDLEDKSRGVDLSCSKLPEPPQSTGQVYAFVQRIKNFGSISKNEISKGISKIAKKRSSLSKMPTSKFYETCDIPEDTTTTTDTSQNYIPPLKYDSKSLGKKSRGLAKLSKLGRLTINKLPTNFNLNDSESDYQTSRMEKGNNENNSSLNLSENDVEFQNQKNNKSFSSKFRKSSAPSLSSSSTSNIYGSLASKNSTFYVTDSVDVDSGIFAVNEKSTSSPDNSNLNLSSASNSSNNITCDPKRRSIASISTSRPKDSPPPPPPSDKVRRSGASSWYAECGLFKSGSGSNVQDNDEKGEKIITSWYHESGLYHTSNNSVSSSSGSSGVSTGGECSPCGDENSHSMFLNEPLYQLYTAAKLESISSSEFEPENESDGYEEIHKKEREENENKKQPSRPTALQLIEPNHGPSRTLWCEVQEVIQSDVLSSLTLNEKKLQEAKFEILTSEASYLKSLNLLKSHFMNHPAFRDPQNLDPQDRKALFSYIIPVQECSDRLLCDLESCWQDSIMLKNLAKSIFKHAEKNFHVYISYCEHQGRLDRTLKRLKEFNAVFKDTLDILENDPICCGLTIHSFLMLPMQRITRLPLLIDAVMTKLKSNDDEFDDWKMAMAIANKIVDQCNQAANRCEQAFEMETLSKQIEFQQNISPFPLIPFTNANGNGNNNRLTRTLVRRGELVHIIYRGDDAKLTFGKKATVKKNIYCFLFTDVIILTKKKSEDSFVVFDYCQRSLLQLSSGDVIPQFPAKDINQNGKYIMFMSLLENHAGKPVDLILACPSETERQRWLQATAPPTSENPYETLYEQWDCPQVAIKHSYPALEPDELTLDVGDVVNVLRKMKDDGWYFGERIRDGTQGWFPGNHSEEVHSAHVRARNLKQRHRLLLYTATYLESQKDANVKRK